MRTGGYHLFETSLGVCGLAWLDEPGQAPLITHFQLPEASVGQTEARLAKLFPFPISEVPPDAIRDVIVRVRRHLAGDPQDFRDVGYGLEGVQDFARAVYFHILKIPAGQTTTYGAIARALGRPMAAQAVGQALGNNPIPLLIPCHRVLAAGGKPGGFSAPGGRTTKSKLLDLEGVPRTLEFEF